jgi:hypothetical protein
MDKQLFEQLLSQVADWEMPKLKDWEVKEAKKSARGKNKRTEEELYQIEHEEIFKEIFGGVNPTMTPELKQLKVKAIDCPDCGKHCPNGRKEEIKYYHETPGHIAHQRRRCLECNRYRDPDDGTYTLPQGPACHKYLNWAKREFVVRKKMNKLQSGK